MSLPPIPLQERARLENLHSYHILDTPPEQEYEEIVRLASLICDTPISTVTLIDEHRQWFKARRGLDKQEDARDISFCAHAVSQNDMLVVPDATVDERFVGNPLVIGNPHIRFYAGVPLRSSEGHALGTLCVIDTAPRHLTGQQLESLEILSRQVMRYLELRRKTISLTTAHEAATRLVSVIGHDVRGPLHSLRALITLVEDFGLSPDDFKSMLPDVKTQIAEVTQLLSNMLEWSASQFDRAMVHKNLVNLHAVVDENGMMHHSQFKAKRNRVLNQIDVGLLALSDENLMAFVLRNLMLNANKFSQNADIMVKAVRNNNMIEVSVRDSGVGIPADRLSTLFSWKHRQSTVGTGGEKGSGFALLIAYDFIRKNGGDMWATSEPGKGTTISFSVPAALK